MRLLLALAVVASTAAAQPDSTWQQHDAAARAARLRGDWRGSLHHLERMDVLLAGHPQVVLALARAHAQSNDTSAALRTLRRLAAMGLAHDVATDTLLGAVRAHRDGAAVAGDLRDNGGPAGAFHVVATLPDSDDVGEGVAWDPLGRRLIVSSMRRQRLVAVTLDGAVTPLVDLTAGGGWAGLAVVADSARDRLWVTTEWSPVIANATRADSGRSAILRYALRRPGAAERIELTRGAGHEPGDAAVGSNGDLFVSDGRAGVIYVVRDGRLALDTLVRPGELFSPQGIAPDRDGRRLFVADYVRGIAVVDRATGALSWLPHPPTVMANGVDGLLLRGDALIGVQNGVTPDRVVAFDLNPAHTAIVGARVLARDTTRLRDPTHLTAVGDDVYFVANGNFDAYDAAGARRGDVPSRAPAIARVRP